MGRMPAGAHPQCSGMPTALVAGRGVLRGSGTILRPCLLQDLGAQLQTGPSWSPCGTVCGKVPTGRAPRAKGLVGSTVPAHMAGSAQHRWAFSLWLCLECRKKLPASCVRLGWFGNFAQSPCWLGMCIWNMVGQENLSFSQVFWGSHLRVACASPGTLCSVSFSDFSPSSTFLVFRWFHCFASLSFNCTFTSNRCQLFYSA